MNASQFYLHHGVPKSYLTHLCQKVAFIPADYQDLLSHYKLLKWQASYLLDQVQDGYITRYNIPHLVIFSNITRGALLSNPDQQVFVSFRAPIAESNIPAYVLISQGH